MRSARGGVTAVATWLDLVVTAGVALLAAGPAVVSGSTTAFGPADVPIGFALVFLLPGYAVVAAFHPTRCFGTADAPDGPRHAGPTALERLVVAIGLSVMIVPLVGVVWNFTPQGIAAPQVLGSLLGIVLLGVSVAAYRRVRRPPADRFRLPLERLSVLRSALGGEATRETTASLAVALLVLVSVVAVSTAIAAPQNGESYTELSLLTEDPDSGALTADGYPTTLAPGEPREFHVGIGNHEAEPITYTVVVELQRLDGVGGERAVVAETEVDRFTRTVAPGDRTQVPRTLRVGSGFTGRGLRLAVLLYAGDPPPDPGVDNAYREVHLWVDVPGPGVDAGAERVSEPTAD